METNLLDKMLSTYRSQKTPVTIILQNVLTRKIEKRIPIKSVNAVESPAFSPDGRLIAFSGFA
jgi:Tol biopolymer transport system component